MTTTTMSAQARTAILAMQNNEITEYYIYQKIAERVPGGDNQNTLLRLAAAEKRHCGMWEAMTGVQSTPNTLRIHGFAGIHLL